VRRSAQDDKGGGVSPGVTNLAITAFLKIMQSLRLQSFHQRTAGGVRKSVSFHDAHAPGSQNACHIGKQQRTVRGDQRQIEPVASTFKVKLNRLTLDAGQPFPDVPSRHWQNMWPGSVAAALQEKV
jgi:hypothetical protein